MYLLDKDKQTPVRQKFDFAGFRFLRRSRSCMFLCRRMPHERFPMSLPLFHIAEQCLIYGEA